MEKKTLDVPVFFKCPIYSAVILMQEEALVQEETA